jgi:hypothetical protein
MDSINFTCKHIETSIDTYMVEGVFGSAVDFIKSDSSCQLWEICCKLVRKQKAVWLKHVLNMNSVEKLNFNYANIRNLK